MALAVFWTEEAEHQLDAIVHYLETHWTDREIRNFFKRLESAIEEIASYPHRYMKSLRKPNTYEYQLSTQTTIFYNYNDQELRILLLWANKQDPQFLK